MPELIAAKREAEHGRLGEIVTPQALAADVERLRGELAQAAERTKLPDQADRAGISDFVVRARKAAQS